LGGFCLLLLLDELDVAGGGDGDDEDADVGKGDDEMAVAADALDGALDALEGTTEEADALAFATEEVGIREEGALTKLIVDRHGAHELLHLTLGDGDDNRGLLVVAGTDGHELQVGAVAIEHLQIAQLGAIGIDKDEIVDQGLEGMDEFLAHALRNTVHGEEIAHALFVEGIANDQLTAIRNIHGVPGIGTSACVGDTGGDQRFFLNHIAHHSLPWTSSTLSCNQTWGTARIKQKERELSLCPFVI